MPQNKEFKITLINILIVLMEKVENMHESINRGVSTKR
jgi:hypothetical protein